MADSTILPGVRATLVARDGTTSPEFYRFFRSLSVTADLPSRVDDLTVRVRVLEDAGHNEPTIGNVQGQQSIVSEGILSNGLVIVYLEGDVDIAPALSFYGALNEGAKGWQTFSGNFEALDNGDDTQSLDLADLADTGTGTLQAITRDAKGRVTGTRDATITGTEGRITVAHGDASDGVPTIDLATVADAGGGTLRRTAFDAYGRKTGTSAATTTDLPEGDNLYFTDARAQAAVVVSGITDGDTDHSPSGDAVFGALAGKYDKSGGTITGTIAQTVAGLTTTTLQNADGWFAGCNIAWDGAAWVRGDPSKAGVTFSMRADLGAYEIRIDSGSGNNSVLYGDATGLKILGNTAWHAGNFNPATKADDNAVMHKTGAETAAGVKTFSDSLVVSNASSASINVTSSGGTASIRMSAPTGALAILRMQTVGSDRWYIGRGSMAETGGNAGSRFEVRAYSDAGAFNFFGLTIDRDTGDVTLGGHSYPRASNTYSCGIASRLWSVVYAATGAINTSDAREKTAVDPLTADELAASADLARAIGTYQWLASIAGKGAESARHHAGLTVQRAIQIMQGHGLDPMRYGFICFDEWPEQLEQVDEETGEVTQEYRPAGDRYSFRTDELLLFLARGFAARLDALEAAL